MAQYVSRVSHMTQAINTMSAFTLDAEGATVADIPVGSAQRIVQIIVSVGASVVAVASAGVVIILRLKGTALIQQDIVVGSLREDTTSTGGTHYFPPTPIDVDIPLTQNGVIGMAASMIGVDPGTPELVVTLVLA